MHGGLEPSWNGGISQATLNPQPVFPELYYPLWWYSGAFVNLYTGSNQFIQKGSTSNTTLSGLGSPQIQLFTMNLPSNTQFALEATVDAGNALTAGVQLWDVNTQSVVSASSITTSSSTTVIRSGKFNLTSGHAYAITNVTANSTYVTDASLIIFPPTPLTSPSVSSISLANASGNILKESYIPLWIFSSGVASSTGNNSTNYLQKGSLNISTTPFDLYNLSSQWESNQKFALEASVYQGTNSYITYAQLRDITSNSDIGSSQISTVATTSTLVRSGSFTLTQGHSYGVSLWCNAGTAYLSKVHLVALAN